VFENHNVTMVEEGGILDSGEVLGSDKAVVSGFGVVFNLDSRDIVEAPTTGHFLQLNARFASEILGSTASFNKFIVDLRTYLPVGEKSLVALQAYSENTFGDIPFQALAWFGGGERARGYFRGRFIDDHQYVIQAEYRLKFHPRWTAAGFVLMGEVANLPGDFLNDVKPSAGGGIRFKLTKDQNTLLRLDVAAGKDGSSGVYFGVNEAF
jgi:outer membrane translocation and assembly module TamA